MCVARMAEVACRRASGFRRGSGALLCLSVVRIRQFGYNVGGCGGVSPGIAEVLWDGLAGAVVATILDPPGQLSQRGRRGIVGDGRRLGDRVDLDGQYARAPRRTDSATFFEVAQCTPDTSSTVVVLAVVMIRAPSHHRYSAATSGTVMDRAHRTTRRRSGSFLTAFR